MIPSSFSLETNANETKNLSCDFWWREWEGKTYDRAKSTEMTDFCCLLNSIRANLLPSLSLTSLCSLQRLWILWMCVVYILSWNSVKILEIK